MNLNDFLIEVVKYTDGWVIVVVFAMYAAYHVYKKHKEGAALEQTLRIVETTLVRLLENIQRDVGLLTQRLNEFLLRLH
jgi:hypothetical protein